jgi:Ner family transcriptional regulator
MSGWHPQDIIAAVRKSGSNLQRLARENGFALATLNRAISQRWPAAHLVIARQIGVSRHEIWPNWYAKDDTPLHAARDFDTARRAANARRAAHLKRSA